MRWRRAAKVGLLVLLVPAVLYLASLGERELLFARKRALASRLDRVADDLAAGRMTLREFSSSTPPQSTIKWHADPQGRIQGMELVYEYEVDGILNYPVPVFLHINVVCGPDGLEVQGARIDEPFG